MAVKVCALDFLLQEAESSAAVPHTNLSSSVSEENGHPRSVEPEADLSSCIADNKQKLKKHKKHKQHHDSETESCSRDVAQPEVSTTICDGLTKSIAKKRKKKHQEDFAATEVHENGDKNAVVAEECSHKVKKSAKKRKNISSDVQNTDESGEVLNTTDDLCKQTKTADGKNFTLFFSFDCESRKRWNCIHHWTQFYFCSSFYVLYCALMLLVA